MKILAWCAGLFITTCSFAQPMKPHTIGIVVSDIDKSTKWYEEVLAVTLYKKISYPEYDSLKIYFLKGNEFQLELMEKKTAFTIRKYVPEYSLNNEPLIGFSKVAFSVKDLDQLYKRLTEKNITPVLGITEDKVFMIRHFIIRDLDGNVLQFIEPMMK